MKSLEFDPDAFEDLAWWIATDGKQTQRIVRMIREILREPFSGAGKPEPFKNALAGCWSRRIHQEHRLVNQVFGARIRILSLPYHY